VITLAPPDFPFDVPVMAMRILYTFFPKSAPISGVWESSSINA